MVLSDFEAAYLISGVEHPILTEAVMNRTVKAGNCGQCVMATFGNRNGGHHKRHWR